MNTQDCMTSDIKSDDSIDSDGFSSQRLIELPPVTKRHSTSKKRQDLQGIRGFAILSVLGFHFLPSIFPNGYLGVDHALLALFNLFPDTAYETNIDSGKRALTFLSNRAATEEEDYFSMLAIAVDIFTHTWSLSVEVQFYMTIPIIFLLGFKIFLDEYQIYYYGFFGILSFVYSNAFCTESVAFNSVSARIWQFVIGIIVYKAYENNENMENEIELFEKSERCPRLRKYIKTGVMTVLVWIVAYPVKHPVILLRPFFTIATGILMTFSHNNGVLTSSFLIYIGDISYSLYLIHWPIYAYWKLEESDGDLWNRYLFLAISLSFALAILSYEFFEKCLAIFCVVLLSMNVGALYKDQFENWLTPLPPQNLTRFDGIIAGNISFDLAERLNHDWSVNDFKNLWVPSCEYEPGHGPLGWCRHKGLDEIRGKYKLTLIGNSWAANHGRLLYQECGYRAKSFLQGSSQGCDPLFNPPEEGHCKDTVRKYGNRVIKENPDYLFLITKFNHLGDPFPLGVTRVEDDPIYQAMQLQTNLLAKNVKRKIYVLLSIPHAFGYEIPNIVKTVRSGADLYEFDKILMKRSPEMARLRYEKLIENCEKCIPIDYKPLFWNTTTNFWRFYDEKNNGLSYVTSPNHLSYHGLELVRSIYTKICGSFQ